MSATFEHWQYPDGERVWAGKYKNSQNIMHWHNDCELIYAERGTLDVTVEGTPYVLTAGNAMFIGSEQLHRISARDPSALLITIIFDIGIVSDFIKDAELCSASLVGDYGISDIYSALTNELTKKPNMYAASAALIVAKLVLEIFRTEKTEQKKPRGKADVKLKSLFAEIRKNYDSYTLDDAAEFMGMNASYLSRFFTKHAGMHFVRYLNCVRVENAVAMLAAKEYSVTEIASRCGFETIRNFNRIFKLLTGYAPSALPRDYVFTASDAVFDAADPSLYGCELVESSSSKK